MTKRKLVKQGAATLMISLPSKWVKENKLDKGDEVELDERVNELILKKANNKEQIQSLTLEITSENKHDLRVLLTHAYRRGFDKIILTGEVSSLTSQISSICSNVLLGFEIVERTKDKIVIENISQPDNSKYNSMLFKVFLIIKDLQENLMNMDFKFEEIKDTKDQCDRFILFCRRIISDNGVEVNPLAEWEFLTFLTHIQHRYFYLAQYISDNKIKLNKNIINLIQDSKEYFALFEDAYKNKNLASINKINSLKERYQSGKCLELLGKSHGKESIVLAFIAEIFRLIQIGTSPIFMSILEKEY
jgi:phosphate uptake regulator